MKPHGDFHRRTEQLQWFRAYMRIVSVIYTDLARKGSTLERWAEGCRDKETSLMQHLCVSNSTRPVPPSCYQVGPRNEPI